MIEEKINNEVVDNEMSVDGSETNSGSCDDNGSEVSSDNVSDESFESGDNSAQLSDEAAQWKDKYLRLVAEFDNYRKRTLKEKMELISAGGEDVIKALLNVVDDIDRALVSTQTAKDVDAVREGVILIHAKLMEMLRSKGVSEIEALGNELDTDVHEAIAKFPVEGEKKGKIIDIVQKGYKLKDKVVRFAKVVVGE